MEKHENEEIMSHLREEILKQGTGIIERRTKRQQLRRIEDESWKLRTKNLLKWWPSEDREWKQFRNASDSKKWITHDWKQIQDDNTKMKWYLQENEPKFERTTPSDYKLRMMTRNNTKNTETLRNNEEWKVEPNMRINSNRSWRRDMTDRKSVV